MAPPARATLRAHRARSGCRRVALRPRDLRGAEGVPSRRRIDLVVPSRSECRSDAAIRTPSRVARTSDRILRRIVASAHRPRWRLGAVGPRDQPVSPPVHVRQGSLPRRAARSESQLLRDREPRRRLLHRGSLASIDLAVDDILAGRQGRYGSGENRRQLRRLACSAGGGIRSGLSAGAVPRLGRGKVHRRAGRHERCAGEERRDAGHPCLRQHPRGHHPRQHPATRRRSRP